MKSRAARDGNKQPRENYFPKPAILKTGTNVLVRDHVSKVFQPKYLDFVVVKMEGKNQVIVKDNHGHENKGAQKGFKSD